MFRVYYAAPALAEATQLVVCVQVGQGIAGGRLLGVPFAGPFAPAERVIPEGNFGGEHPGRNDAVPFLGRE